MQKDSKQGQLGFEILAKAPHSQARAGCFKTLHGEILTPLFMPVGTQATVRNVHPNYLRASGSQILLANTYHLFLRPGKEVFEKFGGIHSFMKWDKSVLTDSGGFQVFSLPKSRKITEEGVTFESYVDGSKHLLSPETSIGMQRSIGSDIMMAMDVCIPSTSSFDESKVAMEQTHRWAVRSLEARGNSPQALFGIIQGATHEKLREQSADFISSLPFDGLAIGGLAVGETKEKRERFTEIVTSRLAPDRPRYLMGVGTPIDLLEAVHRGVDMFDCIIPTKLAEQGVVYTSEGKVQLIRGSYKFSEEPLDPACACATCKTYSKAYLHHLVKACEPLSTQLLGDHNIWFYHSLMAKMRNAILEGRFDAFYKEWQERLIARDTIPGDTPPKVGRRPDRRPLSMGEFELFSSSKNLYSIKHRPSGEVMHPGENPMKEARELYIAQSGLREKLNALKTNESLVVWDVGLGAAFNAMAVIEELNATSTLGTLHLVSFEKDLDALKLALCHPAHFPHLKHGGPHALLDHGLYKKENLKWELKEGNFLETLSGAEKPDLIFFDPFSSKTDSPLWSLEAFQKIFEKTKSKPCSLFNYTASTLVRARLLLAGFYVAQGQPTPPKEETTIAFTQKQDDAGVFLGKEWMERLQRSGVKNDIHPEKPWEWTWSELSSHPQFLNLLN